MIVVPSAVLSQDPPPPRKIHRSLNIGIVNEIRPRPNRFQLLFTDGPTFRLHVVLVIDRVFE